MRPAQSGSSRYGCCVTTCLIAAGGWNHGQRLRSPPTRTGFGYSIKSVAAGRVCRCGLCFMDIKKLSIQSCSIQPAQVCFAYVARGFSRRARPANMWRLFSLSSPTFRLRYSPGYKQPCSTNRSRFCVSPISPYDHRCTFRHT